MRRRSRRSGDVHDTAVATLVIVAGLAIAWPLAGILHAIFAPL